MEVSDKLKVENHESYRDSKNEGKIAGRGKGLGNETREGVLCDYLLPERRHDLAGFGISRAMD